MAQDWHDELAYKISRSVGSDIRDVKHEVVAVAAALESQFQRVHSNISALKADVTNIQDDIDNLQDDITKNL